jgi:hypothetical protein
MASKYYLKWAAKDGGTNLRELGDLQDVPARALSAMRSLYEEELKGQPVTRQRLIDDIVAKRLHPTNVKLRNYGFKAHRSLCAWLSLPVDGSGDIVPCPCCKTRLFVSFQTSTEKRKDNARKRYPVLTVAEEICS